MNGSEWITLLGGGLGGVVVSQVAEAMRDMHRRSADREERTLERELRRLEVELGNLADELRRVDRSLGRVGERVAGIEGIVSAFLKRMLPREGR